MDQKGYIIGATTFLIMIPVIFICISLLDLFHEENIINYQSIESDSISYTFKDIKRNIPIFTRQIIENKSLEVIENNKTINNSSQIIKAELEYKTHNFTKNYDKFNTSYVVKSIQSYSDDPFYIEVNSSLWITQGHVIHHENFSQLISIQGLNDPLPFIKCKNYGTITSKGHTINYGDILANYLKNKGLNSSIYYQNATSPLIIKKCPYEPYSTHGNLNNLKNCLDNGFFHESNDGSCYLCRLEGKGSCSHYGIETFILPPPLNSSNLNSINNASCCIDHVIFGETNYPGKLINYFQENESEYVLFLENGHQSKYGILNKIKD
ncbi:hypothetical protein [Methanobacterium alcaliphilum]|uniref:hypothetical protein n=1 Tax=Methanobacterium alcaliphilum TaxID=392018 RepID=UPI00200A75E0|nr:hypothetical protein [Methanobacterium alcaliphilum]MCK9151120.1 hypothetical protein [Methanobacterium alcaliphilum]